MTRCMRAVDIVEDAGFCPVEGVSADEALSLLESRSDISLLFNDIIVHAMVPLQRSLGKEVAIGEQSVADAA